MVDKLIGREKKVKRYCYVFVLIVLLSFGFVGCGRKSNAVEVTNQITGYAYLENQTEYDGIKIKILEKDISTTTASDGSYKFDNIPVGKYTLQASFPYYATSQLSADISLGTSTKVENITLKQKLQFVISTDKNQYFSDEIINGTLAVKNISGQEVTLGDTYPFPPYITILNENKDTIFSSSEIVILVVIPITFSVDETKNFNFVWDQKDNNEQIISSGKYFIYADLMGKSNDFFWQKKVTPAQAEVLGK